VDAGSQMNVLAKVFSTLSPCLSQAIEMNAKISKVPAKKTGPPEEDGRIVAGTLKGARECKIGLAKRFDKVEDAIAYLRDL
jgi:hypothetical protein